MPVDRLAGLEYVPVDRLTWYRSVHEACSDTSNRKIAEMIIEKTKAHSALGKIQKGVTYGKLYKAHNSPREGHKCTLIVTEGDSAATFALVGLNVIGRDYYGVFPLRGKFLNVRKCSAAFRCTGKHGSFHDSTETR